MMKGLEVQRICDLDFCGFIESQAPFLLSDDRESMVRVCVFEGFSSGASLDDKGFMGSQPLGAFGFA